MSAEPAVNNVSARWAAFKAALATGDWAKIATWQESERQRILAFVAQSGEAP